MSQSDECLREARECLEIAQAATDPRVRDGWIELAVEWMKMAAAAPEMMAVLTSHPRDKRN